MNDESSFSIIDFGSSKIRLGLFNSYLENSNFIIEDNLITNFKDRIIENHSAKKVIKKLILVSVFLSLSFLLLIYTNTNPF